MKQHVPRKLKEAMGHLFHSPGERRRLARADSSPGRRFAESIPEGRPSGKPGTRQGLIDVIMLSGPGLRRRYFWISANQKTHEVTITFTANAPVDMTSLLQKLNDWRQVTMRVRVVFMEDAKLAQEKQHEQDQ